MNWEKEAEKNEALHAANRKLRDERIAARKVAREVLVRFDSDDKKLLEAFRACGVNLTLAGDAYYVGWAKQSSIDEAYQKFAAHKAWLARLETLPTASREKLSGYGYSVGHPVRDLFVGRIVDTGDHTDEEMDVFDGAWTLVELVKAPKLKYPKAVQQ